MWMAASAAALLAPGRAGAESPAAAVPAVVASIAAPATTGRPPIEIVVMGSDPVRSETEEAVRALVGSGPEIAWSVGTSASDSEPPSVVPPGTAGQIWVD